MRNGSLYYRHPENNLWTVDDEYVQAGVVDGHLYYLSREGVLFKDDVEETSDAEYIVITDSEVIPHYRSRV